MKKTFLYPIILLVLSFFALAPFFHKGFFSMHDDTQVVRVSEMKDALADGQFPVRIVENLGYGFGYPIFNFYAPLPYYAGGLINLIGFDSLLSTKAMFVFGILLSAFTMFYLVSSFYGKAAGVASGIVYLYFPYHAVNIYVRGAVGEFFAYAFLPLVFLGIFKILVGKEKISFNNTFHWIALSSIAFFLVAISHNLTLFMLLLLLAVFFVPALFISRQKLLFTACLAAIIILGVLLSSFYTLPAFGEMGYTNVSSQIGGGANYSEHFVCIQQLWNSQWGFGGSTKDCVDGMSFKLGKLNILLVVISIVALVLFLWKKGKDKDVSLPLLSLILLAASIFFLTKASLLLWDSIPFMGYLQYPWRFLNFSGFSIAILSGFLVLALEKYKKNLGMVVMIGIVTGSLLMNAKLFQPSFFVNTDPAVYTGQANIRWTTSKISDEYLPKGFIKPQLQQDLPSGVVQSLSGEGVTTIQKRSSIKLAGSFKNETAVIVLIQKAYYPNWKATVNGEDAKLTASSRGMTLPLPSGSGTFSVDFKQTALELLGNYLTILGIIVIVAGIIYRRTRK